MDYNTIQNEQENIDETSSFASSEIKSERKKIKISVKTSIIVAVIIIILALAYTYKGFFIAASVDGSLISRLSVIQELEKASGKDLLESLVGERLIENEAKAKNIVITDEEVNAQISDIEKQITSQGSTLSEALLAQGMTLDELKKRIVVQIKLEKLISDNIVITDEEIKQFIEANKIPIPDGQGEIINNQVKEEIRNQKLGSQTITFMTDLKAKANIKYYINY